MSVTVEQAAAWFAERAKNTPMPGAKAMFEIAAAALREKAEREDPKPLTLAELRHMQGEPVYVVPLVGVPLCAVGENKGEWCVVFSLFNNGEIDAEIPGDDCNGYPGSLYEKTWIAYRHKPKEVRK